MDWVDFVQLVRHIYAFDVLPEIDDVNVQVFKVDDFNGGIGHFLGPLDVFTLGWEKVVMELDVLRLCLATLIFFTVVFGWMLPAVLGALLMSALYYFYDLSPYFVVVKNSIGDMYGLELKK
ncbi:unnamed protein product [Prunus armeniaca]|uniref:Uncharacterized protein n=1 Tax=Prunus armeniaca TaxID=36596 RepID=A0A6J5V295_PRUAR|nr:unnamed protein product [Prunus armeniaca]